MAAVDGKNPSFAAVAIGRNEGDRLKRCLASLVAADPLAYVDSGSIDQSVEVARSLRAEVIPLDATIPFTAARARNAGYRWVRQTRPDTNYLQFIDGDCELAVNWPEKAAEFLDRNPKVAMVSGRLRERNPQQSVYNWLCDREWNAPVGEAQYVGGIALARMSAIDSVDGFREDLIAGEEPELCVRLRAAGWLIWRLNSEMANHDASITRFSQWWKRAFRAGYAFSSGAFLHGATPERHFLRESRRAWLWGILLPFACAALSIVLFPLGLVSWLIFPMQVLRRVIHNDGTLAERVTLAFFQVLARFPESVGHLRFLQDRLMGTHARIVEYK